MRLARKLAVLLTAAALAGPASALAQGAAGAGDNQYQDPFGGRSTTSTKGSSRSGGATRSGSSSPAPAANGLSQSPNLGTGSAGSRSSSGAPAATAAPHATAGHATSGAATGALPNTGSDPRLIFLAGLALALFGAGLRLRTADERF